LMAGADAFVVLPGGMGTFDEVFNTLEEALGPYIKGGRDDLFKPIYLLNHDGFFEGTKLQIQKAIDSGFVSARAMNCLKFEDTVEEIIKKIRS
jgi:predicted Rossmann-fold nucleotide-binding protein